MKSDLSTLRTALVQFEIDHRRLPTQDEGLDALMERPPEMAAEDWRGPYLDFPMLDPWGNPYRYRVPMSQRHGGCGVYSTGADGQSTTQGNDDDDISSWNPDSPRVRPKSHQSMIISFKPIAFLLGLTLLAMIYLAIRSSGRKT